MTLSMTAFARQEAGTPWGGLLWELRSVNSRYLETALRLPDDLRGLEMRARELIQSRLTRGKVDATLRFQAAETVTAALEWDDAALQKLLNAAAAVQQRAGSLEPLRVIDCLRWPGVLKASQIDQEGLTHAAIEQLAKALDELVAMRGREGARLAELIQGRVTAMEAIITNVRRILPDTITLFRERLAARLKEVRQELDPNRLEQEIVLFAQKSDVAEELDRLSAHFAEIRRTLKVGGQAGRRLDFLMQELNREANTLGSKSVDIRMTNAAVELKVLIEQMREQVQNIE
jgi:uncharacterized protein (TIGR00255 family)